MAFDFPNSPTVGQLFQPSGGPSYKWNGVSWAVLASPSTTIITSDTPPASPVAGQLWWETDTGALYIYYTDANSSQWVQLPAGVSGGAIIERFYTTSQTWTKPSALKYAEVEIQAPGGGGGGAGATIAGNYAAGGGGGGGGWNTKLFDAASLPASVVATIGAAGTGTNGAGGQGGTITFGALLTMTGGAGGTAGVGGASGGHSAGVGGASAGFDVDGRSGGTGTQSFWNVSITLTQRGYGANSPYGMGGAGGTSAIDGNAAQGYGSGGGGAANGVSAAARPGGAGAPGFIRVREYY